jgi:hypothetical protein
MEKRSLAYGWLRQRWVSWWRPLACAALVGGSLVVAGAGSLPLSAGATSSMELTVAPPPASSAPLSTWEAWSAQQQAFMQGTDWVQDLSTSACQVTESSVVSMTSNGAYGVPVGIVTDAVAIV